MRLTLVTRVTTVAVGIIVLSFLAWAAIVFRSTATTFVEERRELLAGSGDAADDLVRAVEDAYAQGRWSAVRALAADASERTPARAFLVVDAGLRVRAATTPVWTGAVVTKEGAAGLRIRLADASDGQVIDAELAVSDPIPLADAAHAPLGWLVPLPAAGRDAGTRFATRVWHTAGIWLMGVVIAATGALVWVLRSSLVPVDRLTRAARELQAGRIPAPLPRSGAAELGDLVDAFNAATATVSETDRLRKQLVADVAHELRTPVTNLRGQVEALQAGLLRPDAEFADTLQAETRMLERLVDDLQQVALSDAGALRLHLQPLPLRDTLASLLAPLAAAAGAAWSCDGPDDLVASADEDRLRQILTNLVDNSSRHRHDAGLEIGLTCRSEHGCAIVDYRDNGPGIAEADRPHIFDRFFRAEKSRSRSTGGAGLGLTIVKALTEAMGGTIRYVASNSNGAGATFELTLPRARSDEGDR